MIMGQERDLLGELDILMILNDHTDIWDTDTIPMKDRDTALYHQKRP
jgi:L-ascorbate metabolism protein UlaG (beta-lactamase superfamily)